MNTRTYGFRVLMYIDDLICALIINRTGLSISAMTGLVLRHSRPWWAVFISNLCNLFQKDHCELAIQHDIEMAQLALDILNEKAPL